MRANLRAVALCLGLLACGGPELVCPPPALPSPAPGYVATLAGLVVVPARASLRSASPSELDRFVELTAARQDACRRSPPGAACELAALRAGLVALPAPEHPSLFTEIDGAIGAALAYARGEIAEPDRDCAAAPEAVCDARAITEAFARAACEVRGEATGGGHH